MITTIPGPTEEETQKEPPYLRSRSAFAPVSLISVNAFSGMYGADRLCPLSTELVCRPVVDGSVVSWLWCSTTTTICMAGNRGATPDGRYCEEG
ncbi:hypothetical protein JTE90_025649 [Oedothorax gibbosus]|uniref:Uncharacterized protein n=1 Tax=Oedothorax gibbosus TaxID=931172 RepID=A0AAV6U769_9ARAC|nr:hypothetical protein JTE90_025649 [Oedothorax gibbosus]